MLGLAGIPQPSASEWLNAFRPLSEKGCVRNEKGVPPGHKDGWGIAGFPDGKPFYYGRRPKSASEDSAAWKEALANAEKNPSPLLIAHLRKASKGQAVIENTHPFSRDGWLFCHNGTIFDAENLPLKKHEPEGGTDSERFFLFLLEELERGGGTDEALKKAIREGAGRCRWNSLTLLLSNGRSLYAYRCYTEVEQKDYYTLWFTADGGAVCSERILEGKAGPWKLLDNGALLTLVPGKPPVEAVVM
jgi:predicted glutamine amidotransferase